jgi:hypothetical protein
MNSDGMKQAAQPGQRTVAEIVQALSRRIRDARSQHSSVVDAWTAAFNPTTNEELLGDISLYDKFLNRLERQLNEIEKWPPDTKSYIMEAIQGFRSLTFPQVLSSSINSYSGILSEEKILRLNFLRDEYSEELPVFEISAEVIEALQDLLREIIDIISEKNIPFPVAEAMARHVDALRLALRQVPFFGGEVVVDAAKGLSAAAQEIRDLASRKTNNSDATSATRRLSATASKIVARTEQVASLSLQLADAWADMGEEQTSPEQEVKEPATEDDSQGNSNVR